MTSPNADPAPRIASIDALRGAALCGILFVNIFAMGGPVAMVRPLTGPALADPDWQIWTVAHLFLSGTMRGLFSMLFGVGLMIFLGDGADADRPHLFLRRLLLLLLFGIVDGTVLLWPGDILIIYALAGVLILFLHPLRSIPLAAIVAVMVLMLSLWGAMEALAVTPDSTVYSAEMLARESAARLGGYWRNFDYMSAVSWSWTVNPMTGRWVGDAAAFMLVGILLHRRGVFDGDADPALLRRMVILGYGFGLAPRLLAAILIFGNQGGPTFLGALIDQPARLATTLGHVGLFLLLWRSGAAPWLMARLALMGRMALTLYLGQSLLAALIFSGFGLGLWNSLSWPRLWLVVPAILAVEAMFAALWMRAFRYGPAEWLWRWGTYGKRPALLIRESRR